MKIFSVAITLSSDTPELIPILLHSMVICATQPAPLHNRNAPSHVQHCWGSAALTARSQDTAVILLPEASPDTGGQSGVCNAIFKAFTILLFAKGNVYILHYTLTIFVFMLPRESRAKKTTNQNMKRRLNIEQKCICARSNWCIQTY